MAGSFTVVERPITRDIMGYLEMMSSEADRKKLREQEQQKIDISRETLGINKEQAALNKPILEAQAKSAQMQLEQERISLAQIVRDSLNEQLQEKLREARVAAAQGAVDNSRALKLQADKLDTEVKLIGSAMEAKDYEKAAQYAFPHLANAKIQGLEESNQMMSLLIRQQQADAAAKQAAITNERLAYHDFSSPIMSTVLGTPDAPFVEGLTRELWKSLNSKDANPETIEANRQRVFEAVQQALGRKADTELEKFKQEQSVRSEAGSKAQGQQTQEAVILGLMKNENEFASKSDHQAYVNLIANGKVLGKDFALKSVDTNLITVDFLNLRPGNNRFKVVMLNNGEPAEELSPLQRSLKQFINEGK